MALKPFRRYASTDSVIDYFMNNVAERGVIVCYNRFGSGEALDSSAAVITLAAAASGNYPAGILMCDVVNKDLTTTELNSQKNEVQVNTKAEFVRRGEFETNKISGTPAKGDLAYLTSNGQVTPTNAGAIATPLVGKFNSEKDEDGYAKVFINL